MNYQICFIAAVILAAALSAGADTLELKNGKVLKGKYVGGTAGTLRFETSDGVQVVETSQALALTFTGSGASSSAPSSAVAPAAAPASSSITIPAGTTLAVRMLDAVSSRDPQGKRFASTLDTDLIVGGSAVLKAGTRIYGRIQSAQQARRYTGQSALDLRLTEIALGPNLIPIVTSGYVNAGSRSIGRAARGAAAGAAIGAIADGGEGAGKGAAIGAVASGVRKGEAVSVNPSTLLEFKLQQAVSLNTSK